MVVGADAYRTAEAQQAAGHSGVKRLRVEPARYLFRTGESEI